MLTVSLLVDFVLRMKQPEFEHDKGCSLGNPKDQAVVSASMLSNCMT